MYQRVSYMHIVMMVKLFQELGFEEVMKLLDLVVKNNSANDAAAIQQRLNLNKGAAE